MTNEIPFISKELLNNSLYTINEGYHWSNDFSPQFYIELAQRGLISTSMNYNEYGDILLPELQEAYAVLKFKNLHISKKVKKLFNKRHYIKISQDLDLFIPLLQAHHGKDSWFTESYIKMLYELKKYNLETDNFSLKTIILYNEENPVAGEIGYFIGSTYTSLTGFFNREYSNWGIFQLVLLAKKLEERGVSFWNLGHPYMDYKKKLGAIILKREDFMPMWKINI